MMALSASQLQRGTNACVVGLPEFKASCYKRFKKAICKTSASFISLFLTLKNKIKNTQEDKHSKTPTTLTHPTPACVIAWNYILLLLMLGEYSELSNLFQGHFTNLWVPY